MCYIPIYFHTSKLIRKDGRYEGRYIKDYDVQGKGIMGYVYGKTYKEAKEKLLMAKAKVKDASASMPVFVCEKDGRKNYVVPVTGAGLWGGIWGNIALDEDLSTVVGVNFGHKSETPGLGAEITTPAFQSRFKSKQIFENGTLKFEVKKRADAANPYQVDAISGATITSTGVSNMIKECLGMYTEYFQTIKNK